MSLSSHLLVLGLLVLDLFLGGELAADVGGRWAMLGFEFMLILGYVMFILQFGSFFQDLGGRDGPN
jgi:hypothetical protein